MTDKENARPGDSRENGRKADKQPRKYQSRTSKATADYPRATLEEAERALYCIPADCPEEEWSNAGMAFASEFPSDLAVFDAWSQQAPEKYNAADLKSRWRRWTSKSGKTIATLFHIAKVYGYKPARSTAPPSPEAQAKAEQERAKRQAEAQHKAEEAAAEAVHAGQRAASKWDKGDQAETHGYLTRKGIKAHGLRLFRGNLKVAGMALDGCLMVPAMDMDGTVKSLQFIHPNTPGKDGKRNLPKASMKGHFWRLGEFSETGPIYSRGASHRRQHPRSQREMHPLHLLRGQPGSRGPQCTRALPASPNHCMRRRRPDRQSKRDPCRPGRGRSYRSPPLCRERRQGMKDFNDLAHDQGAESVRASLSATLSPEALARRLLADPNTPETVRRKLHEFANTETATVSDESPRSEAEPQEATPGKPEPTSNDAQTVARLARLSPFDYDRIRKDEAKRLNVRPDTLDKEIYRYRAQLAGANQEAQGSKLELYEPEPWPIPVNGAEVLNNTYHAIKRHMAIKDEYAIIAALWIVHAHLFDIFSHTPRLAITAPNAECGTAILISKSYTNLKLHTWINPDNFDVLY